MKKTICGILALLLVLITLTPAAFASADAFTDISASDWYYTAVDYAVNRGIVNGTSDTTFSPHANMTRGQFVTILSRLEGNTDYGSSFPDSGYTDVPDTEYYYQHINWAYSNVIVDVTSGTSFRPDDNILRDELVIMLGRYVRYKEVTLPDDPSAPESFKDKDLRSSAARPYAEMLRQSGMMIGSDGYLNPQDYMTRAEGVTVFMRVNEKILSAATPTPTPTPPFDWENYNPVYDIPTGHSAVDADGGYYDRDLANEIMKRINDMRTEYGVDPLKYHPDIQGYASIRAKELVISFSHTRPDGTDCLTVGQGLAGENCTNLINCSAAELNDTTTLAARAVNNFFISTMGHKEAMLNKGYFLAAVSCYVIGDNVYVCHLFSQKTLYWYDYLLIA
jgi:uncharacterized protein YkwD